MCSLIVSLLNVVVSKIVPSGLKVTFVPWGISVFPIDFNFPLESNLITGFPFSYLS